MMCLTCMVVGSVLVIDSSRIIWAGIHEGDMSNAVMLSDEPVADRSLITMDVIA